MNITLTVAIQDDDDLYTPAFEAGLIAAHIMNQYPDLELVSTVSSDTEFEMFFKEPK